MKKVFSISIVSALALTLSLLGIVSVGARANEEAFNATSTYNSKCKTCHGPKADKKFDPAKSDDEHVQTILKGKKMPKPPHMPGYEAKGITADQAKALLDHMKSLRP